MGRVKIPPFGAKTEYFPYGYGFCQCGCGQNTPRTESGNYGMFLRAHFVAETSTITNTATKASFAKQITSNESRFLSSRQQPGVGEHDAVQLVEQKKYLPPDQAPLDEYKEIAVRYANLRRETQILLLELGQSVKLLDDLWIEGGDLKVTVINKLSSALTRFKSTK